MPYFHLFQQELNSIDLKIAKDIQRRLEAWSENDMITAVVLQGEGGCYCGGVDLDWLRLTESTPPISTQLLEIYIRRYRSTRSQLCQ